MRCALACEQPASLGCWLWRDFTVCQRSPFTEQTKSINGRWKLQSVTRMAGAVVPSPLLILCAVPGWLGTFVSLYNYALVRLICGNMTQQLTVTLPQSVNHLYS